MSSSFLLFLDRSLVFSVVFNLFIFFNFVLESFPSASASTRPLLCIPPPSFSESSRSNSADGSLLEHISFAIHTFIVLQQPWVTGVIFCLKTFSLMMKVLCPGRMSCIWQFPVKANVWSRESCINYTKPLVFFTHYLPVVLCVFNNQNMCKKLKASSPSTHFLFLCPSFMFSGSLSFRNDFIGGFC